MINSGLIDWAFIVFMVISSCLACGAAYMTVFWAPGAAGSGMVELIAYLNGINYHNFIGLNTLVTKVVGVVLAVAASMRVGKEGPLAHIGAIVALVVIYLPINSMRQFRNDRDKRALAASGAGVGVSVAFGAPIGGVLFAYEISKADVFWNFGHAWKTFLATSMANFTLNVLAALFEGNIEEVTNAGMIRFGSLPERSFEMKDMPVFALLGVMGGLVGALFIALN
jgi:chloride channel 7